jgi:Family of unknown function (DUF6112)
VSGLFAKAHFHLLEAAAKVSVNPDPGGIPGFGAAQKIVNALVAFGLLAATAAFAIGAAQWGWGSRNQNYSQATDGKEKMLKAIGGAFGLGAVAAIINFFYGAGTGVK